ncbi:MAG: hypothetical protein H0W25_20140 [Acidimicrobiia bacterium]|nr:hypothetical protein [Acidimicrobiia bacterium]
MSTGLTPKMVWRVEEELRTRTRRLIAAMATEADGGAPVDVACGIAAELRMQAICILLGVPEDDRHELAVRVVPR